MVKSPWVVLDGKAMVERRPAAAKVHRHLSGYISHPDGFH
jgi:hypothetical protein